MRLPAGLRRFVNRRARLLKLLGYPLFAGVVFITALYYSLPIDRISDRFERELSQEVGPPPFGSGGFGIGLGMDVRLGEMELHLLSPGVSATGVQLRPRKLGLGSPIAAPGVPAGAPGGDKDGDKEKKTVKPLFIDRLDVRAPLLELLAGNRVADVQADAFGGTIRGVGGYGGEGAFVNGQIEQLALGRIANLGQILPLPMTGTLSLTVNCKVPPQKLPTGAPPPRPGASPTFDLLRATGVLEVQLKDGTLGDGKAKLVVPGDPFLSQGLTFPRLKLGNLAGRLVVDRGRASLDELHSKSADAELWIEGYLELRDPLPSSELHLYVRFKPSADLVKREATIEILNNAMGAGKRSDGSLGFAVQGILAAPRSRPSKDPPEGVTVRAGTLSQVAAPAFPSLRPGGSAVAVSPSGSPMVRHSAESPPIVNPPPMAPEPPPPAVALPPPSPPPADPPASAAPAVAVPSASEARPQPSTEAPSALEPVQNLPSHQRGF